MAASVLAHEEDGVDMVAEVAGREAALGQQERRLAHFSRPASVKTGMCILTYHFASSIDLLVYFSDHCRFPHVLPDPSAPASPTSPRGGYPGSFGRTGNGSRRPTILGATLEDKMADLSVKEVHLLDDIRNSILNVSCQVDTQENAEGTPRAGGFPKPYSSSPKTRGGRPSLSTPSTPGHRQNTHLQSLQQQSQRIPSADDFPVLGGTATPPPPPSAVVSVGNGHGYAGAWSGPTAAQVLKSGMTTKKAGGPAVAGSFLNGDVAKVLNT